MNWSTWWQTYGVELLGLLSVLVPLAVRLCGLESSRIGHVLVEAMPDLIGALKRPASATPAPAPAAPPSPADRVQDGPRP